MTDPQRGELPTRVVVRAPTWVRYVGLPLMVLWWGLCAFMLVGFLVSGVGVGDGTPLLAAVVSYVLLGLFVVVIPPAAWSVVRYRTVLDLANGRVERRPGNVSLAVSEVRELRALPAAPVGRANRGARVQVLDAEGRVAAQVEESMREWPAALVVLREWARQHPGLVEGEYSRQALLP
ncbi:hypothetical protein KMZ32_00915 [Phycicoccus sp. MAQZ13P-2]|uniref:hypothetical protein n=1 Tax=Phycicoccus mangrovi TaxID=2840470 RepID=UPI001C00580F|nr:hypothetical protein [Phycicoccus mangrovi]MBT9254252.1 hypothetical protein [Phycicoccus mangrovi]MBT9272630.1 hypothetical protein [Phycicoccus mangrovi]